jgi:hypothetical protein
VEITNLFLKEIPYAVPLSTSNCFAVLCLSSPVSCLLMMMKICVFHGGDYEECRLLGCDAVWIFCKPAHAGSSLAEFLYPEDGGDKFIRNVGLYNIYTAPHPKKRHSPMMMKFTQRSHMETTDGTFKSIMYICYRIND